MQPQNLAIQVLNYNPSFYDLKAVEVVTMSFPGIDS